MLNTISKITNQVLYFSDKGSIIDSKNSWMINLSLRTNNASSTIDSTKYGFYLGIWVSTTIINKFF